MSFNNLPPVPLAPGAGDDEPDSAEMQLGDEVTLDPDVADDRVDSAEADRLASGAENDEGLVDRGDPLELP